jgi:hypothetical protein
MPVMYTTGSSPLVSNIIAEKNFPVNIEPSQYNVFKSLIISFFINPVLYDSELGL